MTIELNEARTECIEGLAEALGMAPQDAVLELIGLGIRGMVALLGTPIEDVVKAATAEYISHLERVEGQ